MGAIWYVMRKTVKNAVVDTFRHPVRLILYGLIGLSLVYAIVMGFALNRVDYDVEKDTRVLSGAYLALLHFISIPIMLKGLSSGTSFFSMCDVNNIFTAPLSSKKILIYGVGRQLASMLFLVVCFSAYGGMVMSTQSTTVHLMEIVRSLNAMLKDEGIGRVVYKSVPWIYHQVPAEEDLYAIHHECRYTLKERDISSAINLFNPVRWKKDRRHGLKKAHGSGIYVEESLDYATFWNILTNNLEQCHDVKPVHSLEEILLLHRRFPRNIRLFTGCMNGEMLGGCVVYVTPQVVHAQYISATPEGKRLGTVDAIIHHLLCEAFPDFPYFDFGKSTEQHSDMLNENLIYQKEGFGGRGVCYDWYEWTL